MADPTLVDGAAEALPTQATPTIANTVVMPMTRVRLMNLSPTMRKSSSQGYERARQSSVGHQNRFIPFEPTNGLALSRRWTRFSVAGNKHIAKVEVGVSARARMHIDVNEFRATRRVNRGDPRLLDGLAARRIPRHLSGVDVSTWLEPDPQPLVEMKQDTSRADDDR